ncbi:heme ABC transporter ATP-binding protein [Salinivibrio proteolyticus]|uniref:Heme ABC transporter ATP-binding protein n=1 Tax=Salinivibrio proteolyticus TaxID=334715 RepID=A0ABY7LJS5_9GAMM|nr:heme ABC transporter ATP-binding protein [Salinivibrio proteolyticus]WBA15923.1 heme ABC transporter ATP-binding protein [Salinivibrio proteolyticus]
MTDSALQISKLSYALNGRQLLSEIDIAFTAGQLHVLLGPNGAGKSTLLKQLISDKHQHGSVQFWQQPKSQWQGDEFARRVAFLPQHSGLTFAFSAQEVVEMGATPLKANREQIAALASEQLTAWDISHLAHRPYPILSGGEKQRVHMARVSLQLAQTAPDQAILMLDEPTSALDITHQHYTLKRCRALADQGMTVLLVLHDLNLAAQYADQLHFLKAGRIVLSGDPWQCFSSDRVADIYQYPLTVLTHPEHDCPLIVS